MIPERRLLLIALSAKRERLLLEEPELIVDLLEERTKTPIPGSLEFDERWIELNQLLLDALWLSRGDDARADALAPRQGPSLIEGDGIDSARLIPIERARATAEWLATLPRDVIARVERMPAPSLAARDFVRSLGSEAMTTERAGRTRARARPQLAGNENAEKPSKRELAAELARLKAFYADVLAAGQAVLAVRFRE